MQVETNNRKTEEEEEEESLCEEDREVPQDLGGVGGKEGSSERQVIVEVAPWPFCLKSHSRSIGQCDSEVTCSTAISLVFLSLCLQPHHPSLHIEEPAAASSTD